MYYFISIIISPILGGLKVNIKLNKYSIIAVVLIVVFLIGIYFYNDIKLGESTEDETLIISGAASLKNSLYEIKTKFEELYDIELIINTSSSGSLQKQIENGAPVDLFISASVDKMDRLEKKGLILEGSRVNLLKNELVLIVPYNYGDSINSIEDLVSTDNLLSIGTPSSAPVGKYAKESLMSSGFWNQLEGRMIFGKDVLQVIRYVERGEVGAGIVYSSDTVYLKNSMVKEVFKKETHNPIIYPASIIASSNKQSLANEFLLFLQSKEGKRIFEKYGFSIYE